MDFLLELSVWDATLIVVAAILLDAVVGILKTFKKENENFDIRKLPQFVATNVFPFVGGLVVLAVVAEYVGQPYDGLFYPIAGAVLAKYVAEIKDKLANLFGVSMN